MCDLGASTGAMSRAGFLWAGAAAASSVILPGTADAVEEAPGRVRQLWLVDGRSGNALRAFLTVDGKTLWRGTVQYPGYDAICHLLRDSHVGTEAAMSIMVLEAAYEMQQTLFSWGYVKPIVVTSGFRTIETNSAVGGARYSYHERAEALDLVVPDTPLEVVWQAAGSRRYTGGMGWYPNSHIHIDDGPRRYWRG